MNKLKIAATIAATMTALMLSTQVRAEGGEAGNEKLTPAGLPVSTDVRNCFLRVDGKTFLAQMNARPQFAEFFRQIRAIYPPIYQEAIGRLENTDICETNKPVNEVWKDTGVTQKRICKWVAHGAGSKDLLILDPKVFFESPKIGDDRRAATILREMLHASFAEPKNETEAQSIELQKEDVIFQLHDDFVHGGLLAQREKFVRLFDQYGLLRRSAFSDGAVAMDSFYACKESLVDCQNTFSALDIVAQPAELGSIELDVAKNRMGLPFDSLEFVLARLNSHKDAVTFDVASQTADAMNWAAARLKTASEFAQFHDVLVNSGFWQVERDYFTSDAVSCAGEIAIQGICNDSYKIEGTANPTEAKAIIDYLRSIQLPSEKIHSAISPYMLSAEKYTAIVQFYADTGVAQSLDRGSIALSVMSNPYYSDISHFRSLVDEIPQAFSNDTAEQMFTYMKNYDAAQLKSDTLKFAYLIEKGLLTQDMVWIHNRLSKDLRLYPETKALATKLHGG